MQKNQIHQAIVEHYIHAYNDFDVEGMIIDLHPDVVFKNITTGELTLETNGLEAFKKQAEQAKNLFTQRKQTITNIQSMNNMVEADIAYQAILATDLPNGLKKGDVLNLTGKSIFTFKENKIVEIQDVS